MNKLDPTQDSYEEQYGDLEASLKEEFQSRFRERMAFEGAIDLPEQWRQEYAAIGREIAAFKGPSGF
ncbi:hypothetical protein KQH42_30525, partial [Streptomyces sp. CHA1]|uniref:hypothetical protein n=1 Tax=Streptomyces sp. CHA1 TaxID=2841663 RepID=UPI002095577E